MTLTTKTILLVDDDDEARDLLAEAIFLIDNRIVCYEAINGQDALDRLSKLNALPGVIFLETKTKAMNGFECLMDLRNNPTYKTIPVIMYSSTNTQQAIKLAGQLGSKGYIIKSPEIDLIIDRVRDVFKSFNIY
jgi:CheY-like chemotaxis protein